MLKRLVVFSHFDIDNVVDEYVIYYLTKLKEIASDIVFVSTASLNTNETNKIANICTKIICRENIGYDFMSYKIGLFQSGLDYKKYNQIVICNDSIYGPLYDLKFVFNKMSNKKYDFWGMTKNKEIQPHIQSYFVVFNKNVINSDSFSGFFSNIAVLPSKTEIILKYEVGLTRYLYKNKFVFGSFSKYPNVFERIKQFFILAKSRTLFPSRNLIIGFLKMMFLKNLNPTLFFWNILFVRKNPFIKIELLRSINTVHDNKKVFNEIKKRSDYPIELINKHLKRTSTRYKSMN